MHLKVFRIMFGIVHHTRLPLHTHTLFHPPTPEIAVFTIEIAVHLHESLRSGSKTITYVVGHFHRKFEYVSSLHLHFRPKK